MTKDLSRVSDIILSNFLNVSWLIVSPKLPLSLSSSTGRALFDVNVVFANGLLIVKQYSSSEELSFCNKLTGNFWGFDLQTAAKCPSFPHFWQVFTFATLHLFARWIELPQRKQHLLEGKTYLSCVTFSLAIPAYMSSGCITISCLIAFPQVP